MTSKLLLALILLFGFSLPVLAQEVQVVNVQGKVLVRKDAASFWQPVQNGTFFSKEAELKTASNGKCLLLFGPDKKNTMTVEKNSQIKIEDVIPGDIFLSKGRVFTLIKQLDQAQDFKVRTPTAIAGARGTGWVTEYTGGVTFVSVFEDNVEVFGLDKTGEVISQVNIQEDFRTTVSEQGAPAEVERVPEIEKHEWQETVKVMEQFSGEAPDRPAGPAPHPPPAPGGPKEMQQMIDKMKDSGKYSEEEIKKMQQMSQGKFETMSTQDMQQVARTMQEMGMMDPKEQAMMQDVMSRSQEIDAMTPEQRQEFFRQLEQQYGLSHDQQYQTAGGENTFQQYMGNINTGTPGSYQDQGQFYQGEYQQMSTNYNYGADHYFGGFDGAWSGEAGQYVMYNNFDYVLNDQTQIIYDQYRTCYCPSNCSIVPPNVCPP